MNRVHSAEAPATARAETRRPLKIAVESIARLTTVEKPRFIVSERWEPLQHTIDILHLHGYLGKRVPKGRN